MSSRQVAWKNRKRSEGVEATHVVIGGIVFPHAEKAPYVNCGRSVLGGLEYNEASDLFKCHICGEWTGNLSLHVVRGEGMTVQQYKDMVGLLRKTTLWTPKRHKRASERAKRCLPEGWRGKLTDADRAKGRATMIKTVTSTKREDARSAEYRNLRMLCQAQIRVRLQKIIDELGHPPNDAELKHFGLLRDTIVDSLGLSIKAVWESFGFVRMFNGGGSRGGSYYVKAAI